MGRLELPRVAPLEPKSSASTSFATFAVPRTDVPRSGWIIRESGCGEQMRRSARPVMHREGVCRVRPWMAAAVAHAACAPSLEIQKARCVDRALELVGRPRLERGTY